MGYDEVWKVLADLITDFRRRQETVPPRVVNELRSAKTMIEIFKADPTHVEYAPDIETYLGNVEFYLIFAAQNKFGSDYVDRWMDKIEKARKETRGEMEAGAAQRFVPKFPRGERWIRVKVSEDITQADVEKLVDESGLSYKVQRNGYIFVSGNTEKIKDFVKKMAGKFRGEIGK